MDRMKTNGHGPLTPADSESQAMALVAAVMFHEVGPVRGRVLLDLATETFVVWGQRGLSPGEMGMVSLFLMALAEQIQIQNTRVTRGE